MIEGSLSAVAEFTRAVVGGNHVVGALRELAEVMGADAVLLSRVQAGRKSERIAIHERDAGRLLTPRDRPSLSGDVMRSLPPRPRIGSVWILSDDVEPQDRRALAEQVGLETWLIRDAVFIPLSSERGVTDVLELHFHTEFPEHCRALIISIGSMFAGLWHSHAPAKTPRMGLVPSKAAPAPSRDILSDANPIGLSRAEYMVCSRVKDGLRARDIASDLDLKESTVRSHLRSIYSKANVTGQLSLVVLLRK